MSTRWYLNPIFPTNGLNSPNVSFAGNNAPDAPTIAAAIALDHGGSPPLASNLTLSKITNSVYVLSFEFRGVACVYTLISRDDP